MIAIDFDPPRRQLRQFAFFGVIGLPLIAVAVLRVCGHGWDLSHPAVLWMLAFGAAQLLLFLTGLPHVTRAIFVALMLVAAPIGFVLSHLLMAIIFYLLITPIGFVFRLCGRDVMGRKPDPKLKSYWHVREGVRPPSSYFKLY